MAQGNDELVESRVHARAAYLVNLGFRVEGSGNAFVQLFFGLRNERSKEHVQGIFAYGFLLVTMLAG
jgi:hypothetical protein